MRRLATFIVTGLLVYIVGSSTGMFTGVQAEGAVLSSCRLTVNVMLGDVRNPNHGVADRYGFTWVQSGDGFDIVPPPDMKITGGIIYDPSPVNRMIKTFQVRYPDFGKTQHFSYANFPMGISGDVCVEKR